MDEQEKHKTWTHAVAIWWAMAWRIGLWFFVIMAALMSVLDYLMPYNLPLKHLIENWAIVVLVPALGVYATRAVLNRNYGSFRLSVTPAKKRKAGDASFEEGLFAPILRLFSGDAEEDETDSKSKNNVAAPQQKKQKKNHTD